MKEKLNAYFEQNTDAMVEDIKRLVRIKSVRGPALPGMPYGEGPAAALDEALSLAAGHGFKTENHENYMGTVDFCDAPTELGILAHLDVVHEGEGWSTPPYEPQVRGDRLYGRGSSDDKGPAIAALYAMKAVRALGVPLRKNVRLILGTDEESGMSDLVYFREKVGFPPFSFSPDAGYPVINTEKGGLRSAFTAQWAEDTRLPRILSAGGGHTRNIVPQNATAEIEGMDLASVQRFCDEYAQKTGASFAASEQNGRVSIAVTGMSAHAASAYKGNNAACALIAMLCAMPFAPSEGFERLKGVNEIFPHGDVWGRAAGVAQQDEISGELTLNVGIFKMTATGLEGYIDSRTPLCANEDNMSKVLEKRLAGRGITLATTKMNPPHHTPGDMPFVQTLLRVYEEYTGLKGECLATGGGTYVHTIDGGVAFGCAMPGGPENNVHGPDEFAVIGDLVVSAKMFAQIIIDMCS